MSNISTNNDISNCLIAYIKDLGFEGINDSRLADENNADELIFSEEDKDFTISGYGSMLSQVYATPASKEDLDLSNIRLDSRDNTKHVLVLDESIATQWKVQASNIVCFGATDLGTALAMLDNEEEKRKFLEESKLASYGAELWTRNDFFTDKLVFITGFTAASTPFPNSLTEKEGYKGKFCLDFGKNNLQEFILPIRKDVIDFIDPEELVNNVTIERLTANSPVTVSLRVELSGFAENGAKNAIILTKVFEDADIIKRTTIPNIQIWPNFKADCWKQYYVFTGTSPESNMMSLLGQMKRLRT